MPTNESTRAPIDKILIELGRLVVTWNGLERTFSFLLEVMTNGGFPVRLLTVYAGSVSICSAMRSFASDFLPTREAEHVHHAIKYFEILRAYRDYYIHAPYGSFGRDAETNTAQMYSFSVSAKKRYVIHSGAITHDDLNYVVSHCVTLTDYLEKLRIFFELKNESMQPFLAQEAALFDRHGQPITGSLPDDLPALPLPLEKPKRPLRQDE